MNLSYASSETSNIVRSIHVREEAGLEVDHGDVQPGDRLAHGEGSCEERALENRERAAPVRAGQRATRGYGDVATGVSEIVQCGLREQRRIDRDHDDDVVPGRAQSGDDACERRADLGPVVEQVERKLEPIRLLPDRDALLAGLAEQAPRALGERLGPELREGLRRAEARAGAPDEQDARQLAIRHASV